MSIYIFGDSFIGPFTLIKDNNLKIFKFKGATMKGLTKENNVNRKKILKVIRNKNYIKCMIFNFGQVDLYFTFYYKKFIKKEKFMIDSFIHNYVKFVNSLNCNNCNKIIFSIYPSVIRDKYVFDTLISYGILSKELVNSIDKNVKNKLSSYKFRFNYYLKFNKLLEKYCKKYNIYFINFDKLLLDRNKKVKKKFIDPIAKHNIHLLWEPLIPIILSKIKKCKIKKKYKIDLETSLKKFIENKN